MSSSLLGILRFIRETVESYWHEKRQKRRLKVMLNDKRFPKRFRSIEKLSQGIGASRDKTEKLLLSIGARKSEISDEWTLKNSDFSEDA